MQITKQERERRIQDLEVLRKQREVQLKIKKAAQAEGDLKENSTFDTANDKLDMLDKEIKKIEEIIQTAEVVDIVEFSSCVSVNSTVKFSIDGETFVRKILPEGNGEYSKTISSNSPLGESLMGKGVGDEFSYVDRQGGSHTVRVFNIY